MIAEGWIHLKEMNLILDNMSINGSILEIGSANGKLFSFLHPHRPDWNYVAVDPWGQGIRLQKDWSKEWVPGNLKHQVTQDMFTNNCPYATSYAQYFHEFETPERFDIISMGLISNNLDWSSAYAKAMTLLNVNGIIVGRNLKHKTQGSRIKRAIQQYKVEYPEGSSKNSFIIRNTNDT